jgi:hypothetical protein
MMIEDNTTFYIPTADDYDDYYTGKTTVEDLYKEYERRQSIATDTDPEPVVVEEPIIREKYYYTAGSIHRLTAVVEPHEVLVSKDSNLENAKAFKITPLNKWLKATARFDCNEYEVLRNNLHIYPFIDIENENEKPINVVDMLNHSLGLFIECLQNAGMTVEGVALSNSSRPGKHSFHAVIHTDKVFHDNTTLNEFVKTQIKPNFDKGVSDELMHSIRWLDLDKKTNTIKKKDCIDWGVYNTNRSLRFLNQSKLGKKVRLVPYTNDEIILPCPFLTKQEDYIVGHYGQRETKPVFVVELPQHIQKIKKQIEAGILAPQVQLEETYLSELAKLIPDEIIRVGSTCIRFIWAMARSGASTDLIHNNCKRTSNYDEAWVNIQIKRSINMNVNIGTLRYWASQANKAGFHALSKKYMKQELTNEIHSFKTVIPVEQYHERYVRPFSFETKDTILLKSHLGTGKTTQLVNAIKNQKRFMMSDLIPFKRILIISGRKSFTKFICGDLDECKLGFRAYDERHYGTLASVDRLVIQVESLWRLEDGFEKYDLVAIDESETVAHQFYSEATHRHNMIKNHIVFERCISTATKVLFADAFLGNRTIKISESLRNIEHSIVIENTFCPYKRKAILLKSIKKGKEVPSISQFCNRIMDDLRAGLKIAVIWGSKNKAKAFVDTFLKNSKYSHKLYSSESSPEERNELSNVEENWKLINCLNYTSTITVGVNYDPEDEKFQFDKLYLYASASGGLPRDTAQALLRCRKIKSNTLIYTVDKNALQTALYGRETIRVAIADKKRTILQQNPVAKWENAPKWAEENYIENENENGAKCIAYNDILNGYLEKSGYTISEENVVEDDSVNLKTEEIAFDDIEDVEEEELEKIKRKSKAGFATFDEKLILQKHRFRNQLLTTDKKELATIWAQYMMERKEHYFWNVVGEKHQTTDEYIQYESTQKYIQQSSKKCLKRIALDKLLPILGVKNTAEAFVVENVEQLMEGLKGVEEEVFKAFQTHGSRRKGEMKATNAVEMISMVYENWCGAKVKTTRKRTGAGGKVIVYKLEHEAQPLWPLITSRNAEENAS